MVASVPEFPKRHCGSPKRATSSSATAIASSVGWAKWLPCATRSDTALTISGAARLTAHGSATAAALGASTTGAGGPRDGAAVAGAAEDATVVLDLLVTEREGALAEATRLRSQIHRLLLQIDPEYKQHLPTLTRQGLASHSDERK